MNDKQVYNPYINTNKKPKEKEITLWQPFIVQDALIYSKEVECGIADAPPVIFMTRL